VTFAGWLKRAERMFRENGAALGQTSADPRDEALYLILHALGLPLDSGPDVLARRLNAGESKAVGALLSRRFVDHVPAAYLTREAWLGGLRFYVDQRVLIPRSYFVELLEEQLDPWLPAPGTITRVADVCTGSGCLAVLLARRFKAARVDAIDLSPEALEVAQINVKTHRLTGRVRLLQGDLLGAAGAARYDVILSNPPYEPTAHVDALPAEFRKEPRLALDGGPDGLVLIRRLIRESAPRLKRRGVLLIEVGGGREAFEREFGGLQPHWFPTADGSDCVCLLQAARLARRYASARS
jgi:ribosomal protein L3 glutamine methyltransferase